MKIIGEILNSSIPRTLEAISTRNTDLLINMMRQQEKCGAEHLDINTALTGLAEFDYMEWLFRLVEEHTECGISIDSPNPETLRKAIRLQTKRPILINSVSLDSKYDGILKEIAVENASIVALPMENGNIPKTAQERIANAERMVQKLTQAGFPLNRIFIDPLVQPISTHSQASAVAIETIRALKAQMPEINTICGLSNVSFGLPDRTKINGVFLAICMEAGLDAAILDITSSEIQRALYTTKMLLGQDDLGIEYISFIRNQK